ncbi:MAG TPA: cytochrome b N-terminal domain-containing protein [Myxococcales bacterium]|jgi:quinol-cytochrome oxidoreductase complex cytochrome b subunit
MDPSALPVPRRSRLLPRLLDLTWSYAPRTVREAGDAIVRNFLLHGFPHKVARRSLALSYSLWLGTASAVLFLLLAVTGGILMFLYVPSVERAYGSIQDLESVVSYGAFLRASHRIGAHAMVLVVVLHLMRVFLTGAYKNGVLVRQHRHFNWWIGLALLLLTLLLSFTGYLLPWDQLAYWAITVGTNIANAVPLVGQEVRLLLLGGHEINQSTLLRFYVLHCFALPVATAGLVAWHLWRVRKDGGLACRDQLALQQRSQEAPPAPGKTYALLGIAPGTTPQVETALVDEDEHLVETVPALNRRVLLTLLATLAVVGLLAVALGAPLEEPANPQITPNPAKAPWYFLWLQELVTDTTLRLGGFTLNGALVGGILVPGLLALLGLAVPFLDRSPPEAVGVWGHRSRRGVNAVFVAVCLALVVLTVVGTLLRGPYWNFYWPWESWPTTPPRF